MSQTWETEGGEAPARPEFNRYVLLPAVSYFLYCIVRTVSWDRSRRTLMDAADNGYTCQKVRLSADHHTAKLLILINFREAATRAKSTKQDMTRIRYVS
jgi:hypothetical protein